MLAKVPLTVRSLHSKSLLSLLFNDTWIAAIARHQRLAVISRDSHFDAVAGLQRVAW
jgi:predicted nucleic acid-binding protein